MVNQALFSNKKDYRYMLSRFWDDSRPILGIIALRPSYGDAKRDDEDILKQIEIAKSLGYGGLYSMSIFSLLDSDSSKEPIGENNNRYLKFYLSKCQKVISAWGDGGIVNGRGDRVRSMFKKLYYIELTSAGQPIHFEDIELGVEPTRF